MVERNVLRSFDEVIRRKLGIYVYVLIDPSNRRIFYVGKGGGSFDDWFDGTTVARGNSRVFGHFWEAEKKTQSRTAKLETIRRIWASNSDVEWQIVRYGLPLEDDAFGVEASLIDALALSRNGPPDNDQGGHESRGKRWKCQRDVIAMGALPVAPDFPCTVFVFHIRKGLRERLGSGMSEEAAIYDATRQLWLLSPQVVRDGLDCFAVGIAEKVSVGAFGIHRWHVEAIERRNKKTREVVRKKNGDARKDANYRFDKEDGRDVGQLLMKNWSRILAAEIGYFQRAGGRLVVQFDGKNNWKSLLPNRANWRSVL